MLEALLLYALAEFVFSLSPGPAVFLVISKSVRAGFGSGIAVALGVILVNVLYFILSAIGVGTALVAFPLAFKALKILGALYLTWVAIEIVRELMADVSDSGEATEQSSRASGSLLGSFLAGVLTQSSSIKNIFIFLAIIPQFIHPQGPILIQFAGLCIVSVLVELPILIGYAYLASRVSKTVHGVTMRRYLDGASALILFGIAGAMFWSSGMA
ncbi:MAG: LysE family translocator [Rhodobiaceae bacterium]|nr:LysE family translocator [Rhodobiaceae bacterium]MCC0049200.1 LysE family translocator [Rhodobiaceae bacterium]